MPGQDPIPLISLEGRSLFLNTVRTTHKSWHLSWSRGFRVVLLVPCEHPLGLLNATLGREETAFSMEDATSHVYLLHSFSKDPRSSDHQRKNFKPSFLFINWALLDFLKIKKEMVFRLLAPDFWDVLTLVMSWRKVRFFHQLVAMAGVVCGDVDDGESKVAYPKSNVRVFFQLWTRPVAGKSTCPPVCCQRVREGREPR